MILVNPVFIKFQQYHGKDGQIKHPIVDVPTIPILYIMTVRFRNKETIYNHVIRYSFTNKTAWGFFLIDLLN